MSFPVPRSVIGTCAVFASFVSMNFAAATSSGKASQILKSEPALNDIASKLPGTTAETEEIAVCLWKSERPAALKLANDATRYWMKDGYGGYRIEPTSLSHCGGVEAFKHAVKDPGSLAFTLLGIRVNQMARCIANDSAFESALKKMDAWDDIKNNASKDERFVKVALQLRIATNSEIPQSLMDIAMRCDNESAAWVNTSNETRQLFTNEFMLEAYR